MINWTNLDESEPFKKLARTKNRVKIAEALNADRVAAYSAPMAGGLTYNYAAKEIDDYILDILQELSDERQLIDKYRALLNGEVINTGEKRMVLHHLARGQCCGPVIREGKDLGRFYAEQIQRIDEFAQKVRSGKIAAENGKPFTTVVQIGIGGSDLGPRALYIALENHARSCGADSPQKMKARFISNVDPDDAAAVCADIDLAQTLFILVSKSGTTQETLANERFAAAALKEAGLDPSKHIVAVTSETSPLARNAGYLDSFYIDDFIGGRYSSSSAVGGVVLSLAFGAETFREFLSGAHEADLSALESDIRKNPALLDALIGVYERNVQGYGATAILPYSQALSRFPAHLQQADMESNGKSVNRRGEPINYSSGPIIFGEPGTNGQHSFYQLLHQGSDITPLQFIGFKSPQMNRDLETDGSTSQKKLCANLCAQIVAFACGKSDSNPNKNFAGGRPSGLIYGDALTPRSLGALLAHFENKIMFQGFIWNLNSFDQEGVQLGKKLTKEVLSGTIDGALKAYADLFGITS